ncbi:MAG: GNAT family N-acetyltransferase [Candidatus Omnitrophota bacterium]
MKLRTRFVRKIEDIPSKDWNSIFPDVLEGYDFFKSLDQSKFEQFSFYYIIVYNGKTAVGAAPCFCMRYSLDTSMNGPAKRIVNRIKKINPNMFSVKALICGMPMGKGFIGIAGGDKRIVQAIFHRMEQIARHEKAPIIAFKDFGHNYNDTLAPLLKKGFVRMDSLPYAEMDLGFSDFDDYLKTKLSGASRYDMRRKFKKVAGEVKIDMEVVDELKGDVLKEVYSLYLQMLDKHEMGFEIVPMDFFKNITKNMPNQVKFFLWRIDGKLVAFLFALIADGTMIDYYLGLDYAVAHKYHLFFIKHRDAMNWAIENGMKRYEMGISGYEPKKRLGFYFTPLHIYAKYCNPVVSPAFKLMCNFLKFENFDPELKKIKKEKLIKVPA